MPKGAARFRLQVMADHTEEQVAQAAAILQKAYHAATAELEAIANPDYRAIA